MADRLLGRRRLQVGTDEHTPPAKRGEQGGRASLSWLEGSRETLDRFVADLYPRHRDRRKPREQRWRDASIWLGTGEVGARLLLAWLRQDTLGGRVAAFLEEEVPQPDRATRALQITGFIETEFNAVFRQMATSVARRLDSLYRSLSAPAVLKLVARLNVVTWNLDRGISMGEIRMGSIEEVLVFHARWRIVLEAIPPAKPAPSLSELKGRGRLVCEAAEEARLDAGLKDVLHVLAAGGDEEGVVTHVPDRVADRLCIHTVTVSKRVRRLCALGWLAVVKPHRGSHRAVYRLLIPTASSASSP